MGRGSVSPSAHAARSSLDGPDSSCDLFSEMGATRAPVSEVPVLWAFPARRRPRNVIVTVLSLFFAVFSLRESGFGRQTKRVGRPVCPTFVLLSIRHCAASLSSARCMSTRNDWLVSGWPSGASQARLPCNVVIRSDTEVHLPHGSATNIDSSRTSRSLAIFKTSRRLRLRSRSAARWRSFRRS